MVHSDAKVLEVLAEGVRLANGRVIPAGLVVWAVGGASEINLVHTRNVETSFDSLPLDS